MGSISHSLYREGSCPNIRDDIGHVLLDEFGIRRVKNVVERALRPLYLSGKQRFLANVHRKEHVGVRDEPKHPFELADFPGARAQHPDSPGRQMQASKAFEGRRNERLVFEFPR